MDISLKVHKNQDPHNEAIKNISTVFKKKWITSYDYTKQNILHYQSKKVPGQLFTNQTIKPILYLTKLTHAALYEDHNLVSSFLTKEDVAWKETLKYNEKGGLCIYASVLLYYLLLKTNEVSKNKLSFMQGFYHHEFHKNHFLNNIYQNGAFGLHSYILFDGYLIDTTIHQIAFNYYPGEHTEFSFIGETTAGINLYGFKETNKIVHKYAKKIARESNMTIEEWIEYHHSRMNKFKN
ncbi:TPA: hypothetical protein ACR3Z0_005632 [Bacillus thuringiensis]|uniref:Uncharacterized protein n=1 Tax=Bacillus thuringiensis TaxID=1428 RepID=A0A9X6L0I6_BACTU|nr:MULTISPECIES: hypothetical protein [Bacillus cereus group]ETE91813.1 hypothetical protein C621_0217080 [Bacillus thuringiensis serovar aizawai str. Leapi01]ETE97826.1 hypothetical protein C623_0212380 [Bacillus thuringiensis serovar aizawai str. Hu4-2]KAB1374255.1 hypothetical protein FPG93_28435 [Bacillus thuringiensis]KLA35969.1 hypothetical protein B4158_5861 [Bacillus cereus]KMP91752.1 hypothetical protein TU66_35090 [Bacillus cereus]